MTLPKPQWLKIRSQALENNIMVEKMLKNRCLHTVCEEASCPNINECFSKRTVTFMILGRQCTRNCTFCTVNKSEPEEVMENEPQSVAEAVSELDLKHVVITSVTRDDLADGGAGHFARVIKAIRDADKKVAIEVLIPDFKGDNSALETVIKAKPDVIGHNIETVPRLYPDVRPMAIFERSVSLLKNVKKMSEGIYTKSGIMVGLGEREDEVTDVLKELRKAGCDLLTIGQYLSPSKKHHPVIEYIHPDTFKKYKEIALELGFAHVASAPFVRSSYHASDGFGAAKEKRR